MATIQKRSIRVLICECGRVHQLDKLPAQKRSYKKKRHMSAEHRATIAAATRARWAKQKAENTPMPHIDNDIRE